MIDWSKPIESTDPEYTLPEVLKVYPSGKAVVEYVYLGNLCVAIIDPDRHFWWRNVAPRPREGHVPSFLLSMSAESARVYWQCKDVGPLVHVREVLP
jgi:hypothetical protein